jgi:hypothetical protein
MVTFWLTPNIPFGMGPAALCRGKFRHPGGVNYRFQYYDPETGDSLLRYDNSRVPTHGAGHHHRHEWVDAEEQVTKLEFEDLDSHLADFETEVIAYDR